jgi:tetratricopeptide (TPR) repeat protein
MDRVNKAEQIQEYIKLGELQKAISTGEEILNQYNRELESVKESLATAYEKQGKICQQQEKWEEAKNLYRQGINYNPMFLQAYGGLCDIFFREKAWQELKTTALEGLKVSNNVAWLYIHLMTAYKELGEEQNSLEMWQKACEIKGWQHCPIKDYRFAKEKLLINHLDALSFAWQQLDNNQAINALEIGAQEGLVTCWLLDNLLTKNTDNITCISDKFSNLFSLNIGKSNSPSKVKQLTFNSSDTIHLLPKNHYQIIYVHPQANKGNMLPISELVDLLATDGLAIISDSLATQLKPEGWEIIYNKKFVISRCKINRGYSEETESLKREVETSPTAKNYLQLGKTLKKQDYLEEAIECYFQAMTIDPYFLEPFFDLRFNFLRYKLKDTSSPILDRVIDFCKQLLPQNPEHIWLNIILGYALTRQGKIEQAINYYQQASDKESRKLKPNISPQSWSNAQRKKPQFIVIGAEKCGTTSLYWYLRQHPKIFTSLEKELDFFDQEFGKGIDWYLAHFSQVPNDDTYSVGEVSPNYIYSLQAPQRIYELLPKVKLIVLLRNPIERTISRYFMIGRNTQKSLNIGEDLTLEINQLREAENNNGDIDFNKLTRYTDRNVGNSLYYYHLKRWLSIFPREQLLAVKSEDFYEQPSATMTNIFDYLGLPNYPLDNYPKHNSGDYSPIDGEIRAKLGAFFNPHNQRLEDLLGLKFNWH